MSASEDAAKRLAARSRPAATSDGQASIGEQELGDQADGLVQHVGRIVKWARKDRYSIEQLAQVSGVSAGLISQIERGIGNPSLSNLLKLAQALDVPLGRFFTSGGRHTEGVVRRRARPTWTPGLGIAYQILTPPGFNHVLILSTLPPGFDNRESPFRHAGDESLHVLQGKLAVYVSNRRYVLSAGDTITHRGEEPHWYRTLGTEAAVQIGAVSPPHIMPPSPNGSAD